MGRYLKHAVRRGVHDQISRPHMGIPIVLNHLGSRIGQVAEGPSSRLGAESLQNLGRKSLRISWQRSGRTNSRNLPVAYSGILPLGSLPHTSISGPKSADAADTLHPLRHRLSGLDTLDPVDAKQSQLSHMRHGKERTGRHGSQCIHIHIPILSRIFHSADSETVQDDQKHSFPIFHTLFCPF